ncbi:hypothetical protein HDU97_008713 [Phlyctochytrium planicorne]|nr:hypothetical protein HDU97_008713 [Phlyctochytrium planicorne]
MDTTATNLPESKQPPEEASDDKKLGTHAMTESLPNSGFKPQIQRLTRRQDASFLSKWSYWYVNALIKRGSSRLLTEEDYPLNNDIDDATDLSSRLLSLWKQHAETNPNPSLVLVTLKMFWWPIVGSGIWFLVEEMMKLGSSIILGELLKWFGKEDWGMAEGLQFAALLSLITLVIAIVHHINFWIAMRMGIQLRVAYIAAIYRKCLSLSVSHTSSTGFIVNMVANDVQRFEELMPFLHFIWIAPFQLCLVAALMYIQIGAATFIAIGALFILIPCQGLIARQFGKYRRASVLPRDGRLKTVSDMLNGILVVKLYAWEEAMVEKVAELRGQEMDAVGKAAILRALNEGFFFASAVLLEICALGGFWALGGVFTPSKVFVTISLLTTVRLNMGSRFPKVLQFVAEAFVSFRRIQNFLSLPEISSMKPIRETEVDVLAEKGNETAMLVMKDCSFKWGGVSRLRSLEPEKKSETEAKIILKGLNVRIEDGKLTAVIGPVGSGKSSFLNAILSEMDLVPTPPSTTLGVLALRQRKIAYAAQTPWILSDTFRNNILFGRPFDKDWFEKVVDACALERDIRIMPEGVETIVGERGVTLSGGQRARLALARAVYGRDAELYLFDDPLSAVDAKVGRHIFEKCINGLLKDKCRILVTHQLQYVIDCQSVILLEAGHLVTPVAPFRTVIKSDASPFIQVMREHAQRPEDLGEVDDEKVAARKAEQKDVEVESTSGKMKEKDVERKLEIKKEEAAKGDVPLSLYYHYFRSGAKSRVTLLILVAAIVLGQASLVVTDWWLGQWAAQSEGAQREGKWPVGFFVLGGATVLVAMGRAVMFFGICVMASRDIGGRMVKGVFGAPLSFFVENPSGRVMNRMSNDLNRMDESLPWTFFDFVQCFFLVIGTVAVAVVIIPYVLAFVPVVGFTFWYLRKTYLQASRQVKREEAITRSPVYSTIPATLEGLSTVRAFGAETRFLERFSSLQNSNTRIAVCFLSAVRWLGLRLDLIAAAFLIVVAFLSVTIRGRPGLSLSGSTVGLVLSYALQLMGLLQWCFRQSAEVENLMTATERVVEYTQLESEFASDHEKFMVGLSAKPAVGNAPSHSKKPKDIEEFSYLADPPIPPQEIPKDWPSRGEIEFRNLTMVYPRSERPALNSVSLKIPAGTRIGIVGRTGAGKSSLLQALFRLVQHSGSILIDGIDTRCLTLTELRSKISIIPQDPFCFRGTLRFNIDPFSKFTDAELWNVLEKVRLKSVVEALPGKLDAEVTENGSNWSVGERQLICLARAILRSSKLFVMDEATSAIDLSTDAFLANVLRSPDGPFANATILTIAHRLNTIIDYDYVMVMDEGKLVEFGTPHDLLTKPLSDPNAWFNSMVSEMAPDAQNLLRDIASKKNRN